MRTQTFTFCTAVLIAAIGGCGPAPRCASGSTATSPLTGQQVGREACLSPNDLYRAAMRQPGAAATAPGLAADKMSGWYASRNPYRWSTSEICVADSQLVALVLDKQRRHRQDIRDALFLLACDEGECGQRFGNTNQVPAGTEALVTEKCPIDEETRLLASSPAQALACCLAAAYKASVIAAQNQLAGATARDWPAQ